MAGRKIFEPFDVHEASNVQNFLQDQAVMRWNTTADRATELPSPDEGQLSYVSQVGYHEWFNGSDWVPISPTRQLQAVAIAPSVPGFGSSTQLIFGDPITDQGTTGTDWIVGNTFVPPHTGMFVSFITVQYTAASLLARTLLDVVSSPSTVIGRNDATPSTQGTWMSAAGQWPRRDAGNPIFAQVFFAETSEVPGIPPAAGPPSIIGGIMSVASTLALP